MTRKCTRCRCWMAPDVRTSQCDRCLAEQRDYERFKRAGIRIIYTPIDEILAQPLVRLLRGLRRFGWVEVGDLFEAIDAPEDRRSAECATISKALSRAVSDGFIERMECRAFIATVRRPGGRDHNWYRITAAGRAELASRLAVDSEIAADEAEGDVAA